VFNIQGSELIFLLLVALIVLGPEKLPDAVRKFGRAYGEFKKMANGFQGELKNALDDPMRELRDTAEAMKAAVKFDINEPTRADEAATADPALAVDTNVREPGINFGSANPTPTVADPMPVVDTNVREPGLNFGSANPRPTAPPPVESSQPEAVDETPSGLNFGSLNVSRSTPVPEGTSE
jgi:sec-independent protein translocase protein TatB